MNHFPLDRLAALLRGDGVEVDILPGAQGRSARMFASTGYKRGCQAIVEHHTGGSGMYPESDIGYILNGKGDGYVISNAYTWRTKKKITLIASGPTYTEGSGGPLGLIPANGGNSVAFSNEIASPGAAQSPYPEFQQNAVASFAFHAANLAAEIWGWPDDPFGPTRSFSHFEWAPGRKIDPRGVSRWSPQGGMWDMDQFRSELRSRTSSPEDDMAGMNTPFIRIDGYEDQWLAIPISAETKRRLNPDDEQKIAITLGANGMTRAQLEAEFGYRLTPS